MFVCRSRRVLGRTPVVTNKNMIFVSKKLQYSKMFVILGELSTLSDNLKQLTRKPNTRRHLRSLFHLHFPAALFSAALLLLCTPQQQQLFTPSSSPQFGDFISKIAPFLITRIDVRIEVQHLQMKSYFPTIVDL